MKINYGLKNIVTTSNVKLYKEVKVRFCYDYGEYEGVRDIRKRLKHPDIEIDENSIGKIVLLMDDLVSVTFECKNGQKIQGSFCIGYKSLYELEYV